MCFGAVGFKNNVSDSPQDKKDIKKKFKDDVRAARNANDNVKAFVFFCNVDLTPTEIAELEKFAKTQDFTHVDIYWRERLRHVLDGVDGLALRYQYLGISLSEAEQAAFFARFGKELEDLLHGRFDRIEQKLDDIEFAQWKAGHIRSVKLEFRFKEYAESKCKHPEHFRVALALQGVVREKRGIILGGRDDFWPTNDDHFYFGTKTFFWREQVGTVDESWIESGPRVGGGIVNGITLGVRWRPVSPILASEFEGLSRHLHFTENLVDRIKHVRFTIDDYVFLDWMFSADGLVDPFKPSLGWPDELTDDEKKAGWLYKDLGYVSFGHTPKKVSDV